MGRDGQCRQMKLCTRLGNSARTGIGLRRSTMKLSARCMIIRENLFARIASISSICLTLMLIRTELTAVSIITYSFSERWMTIGLSSSSRLVLRRIRLGALTWRTRGKSEAGGSYIPDLDLRLVVALDNLRGKVLDAQRRVKGRLDCVQVRPERGVRPHAGHGRPCHSVVPHARPARMFGTF